MPLLADDLTRWSHLLAQLPTSKDGVCHWIENELRTFFPFRRLLLAHGELAVGQIVITHSMVFGHEPAYLEQLATTFELGSRMSLAWWLEHRQPFVVDPCVPPPFASPFELAEIERFDLRNVAAHGVVNITSTAGSYFSFAGVHEPLSDWHLDALRLIAPVLNDLFLLCIAAPLPSNRWLALLTPRQIQIVRQVLACQDDKSIARTLNLSERTVRNQLSAVYNKLEIKKRTELMRLFR